jgi:hypothetical protein
MLTSKKPPKQNTAILARFDRTLAVDTLNEKAAEAAAVVQFGLDDEQRKRLAVWEQSETT